MICCALVEARSCEKFELLAKKLADEKMREFYARLAREEAGHYTIFIRLAKLYYDSAVVEKDFEIFRYRGANNERNTYWCTHALRDFCALLDFIRLI